MSQGKGTAIGKLLGVLVGTGGIVLILMWLMGFFAEKEEPGPVQEVLRTVPAGARTVVLKNVQVQVFENAVGTITPVQKVSVGAQLMARVTKMNVKKAGERVKAGQVLATLDDQDLQARLSETKAAHDAAVAQREQAEVDLKRTQRLFEKKVESKETLDQARTAVRTAKAAEARSEQTVEHAIATLKYATVLAPIGGVIIDKHVEEGDLVSPGQVLVTLYDPGRMQLIARVRESLAARLVPGREVDVTIEAIGSTCTGQIDQIVPEAEASSRVFEVKVSGPCPPGIYAGMFGRLHLPVGKRTVLYIDRSAIRRVGQIESVYVVLEGGRLLRRFIQTGRKTPEGIEVLAGLDEGDTILAKATDVKP